MKKTTGIVTLSLTLFVWLTFSSTQAFGAESTDLLEHLPGSSKVVVGADFDALRKTQYYDKFKAWLESSSQGKNLTKYLKGENDRLGDIKNMAAGLPGTPKQSRESNNFTLAFHGDFKKEEFKKGFEKMQSKAKKKLAKSKSPRAKQKLAALNDIELKFPKKQHAIILSGKDGYRKQVNAALNKGQTAAKEAHFSTTLKSLESERHVWVMTGKLDQSSSNGPPAERVGLGAKLEKKLTVRGSVRFTNKKAAKQYANKLRGVKKTAPQNPMVKMLGLSPLANNLKIKQSKSDLQVSSHMTGSQLEQLVQQIQYLQKMRSQGAGGAGGSGGFDSLTAPKSGSSAPTPKAAPSPSQKSGSKPNKSPSKDGE